ncbi:hypothetical protein WDW37_07235 [Bdellovibrionota bacterium FG-1]
MAETENISKIAKKVSDELFSAFGWERVGPINQNWTCAQPEEHQTGANTHPSDVVFHYDDPYKKGSVYVSVDLKSYAAASITTASVAGAIASLGKATTCANLSDKFTSLYVRNSETAHWEVVGLLFVYNHDGEFEKSFSALSQQIAEVNYAIPQDRRMFLMGPDKISYLYNVALDLIYLKGRGQIEGEYKFYFPDLINLKAKNDREADAATLEWLTGPWQIIKSGKNTLVYFDHGSPTVDDFKYLLDFLFRYQLVEQKNKIQVRMVRSSSDQSDSAAIFDKAKGEYAAAVHPLEKDVFQKRLQVIGFERIPTKTTFFDHIQIGMER